MRRCFSIFLILLFGLGPLSALAEGTEDASLPSCCRRHGAHHCAMSAQVWAQVWARTRDTQKMAMMASVAVDTTPEFSAPSTCPLYHGPALYMLMPAHALGTSRAILRVEPTRAFNSVPVRALAFSSPTRAHAVRGPPASNPS